MSNQLLLEIVLPLGVMFLVTNRNKLKTKLLVRPSLLSITAFLIYCAQFFIRSGNIYKELNINLNESCPSWMVKGDLLNASQSGICSILQDHTTRTAYQKFGTVKCSSCVSSINYQYHYLPFLYFDYLIFLVVNGILTRQTTKSNRIFTVILLIAMAVLETLVAFNVLSDWVSPSDFFPDTEHTILLRIRLVLFMLIIGVNHFATRKPDNEILANILEKLLVYSAASTIHSILKDVISAQIDTSTKPKNVEMTDDEIEAEQEVYR